MALQAGILCCVHKLGNNLVPFDDATEVFADYEAIAAVLKTMGATSTDNFQIGIATNKSTLGNTVIQILNQVWYWYALNQSNKSLSKVVYYSGHGIPTPPERFTSCSSKPGLNFDLVDNKCPLVAGDWPLHHLGFMGFDCFVSTLFRSLKPSRGCIEKELLIVSDSCYSGNWCEQLKLKAATIPAGYFLTVQASASAHQCAHAGVFAPVLAALQKDSDRIRLLHEFSLEDQSQLVEQYSDLLSLQSPVLWTTRTSYDVNQPVYCLQNFTAKHCFYAFNSALFFWYYGDKLGFLDESILTFSTIKGYQEMKGGDYVANLSKIDPALLSDACFTKDSTGYLAKYRFKDASGVDTHELHVHYNGVPGALTIGALNIRDVVKGKKLTRAKQVTPAKVQVPADMVAWEDACKGLLTHTAKQKVRALRY